MGFLRGLGKLFLLPGTIVLGRMDISPENDGGIFRSFINMIFWGIVAFFAALPFMF